MFPLPSLLTVVKYGFISMVVTSAGFLIGNVIVLKHTNELLDDLVYRSRTSGHLEDIVSGLDREYSKCFTEPTKTFCLEHANEPFRISDDAGQLEREDDIEVPPGGIRRHPMTTLMYEFSEYMNSLGIQAVVLEPSMLFCAVSSSNKYSLLTKDFNPHDFQGFHRTLTMGIFEDDSKILDANIWANKTVPSRFEAFRTRRWLIDAELGDRSLYSVHFLFARGSLEVHVVVLFARNGYLWHSGTDLPTRHLLFTNEGTFENFTTIPLVIKNNQDPKLLLPSIPAQFLFQIPNSQYLNCQPSEEGVTIFSHPTLTDDQLVHRALIAIQELKATFQSHFVNFWLWDKTLGGWFTYCNIFQETFELSIAVSYLSVKRLNLTAIFANNNYLDIMESEEMNENDVGATLDCYGLRINIFICHEEKESAWCHHKAEDEVDLNRVIPFTFRLCSSDALGHRINVPCESGQIIQQRTWLPEASSTSTLEIY